MNELQIFNSGEPTIESIDALEIVIKELPPLPMKEFSREYLGGGMYAKELWMPKNSIVIGKIHLKEHICHISYGDVTVVSAEEGRQRIIGPYTFVGKPGSKRALLLHEDTLWTAFHTINTNNIAECEDLVATNSYNTYLALSQEN